MRGGKASQFKPDAHSCADVLIADFIFTFVLAFGVIAVATVNSSLSQLFGLASGICVTVVIGTPVFATTINVRQVVSAVVSYAEYVQPSASLQGFGLLVGLPLALETNNLLEWPGVGIYMVFQIAGEIVAGLTYFGTFHRTFNLGPTPAHTLDQAALAVILYTFMLCFMLLNLAVCKVHDGPVLRYHDWLRCGSRYRRIQRPLGLRRLPSPHGLRVHRRGSCNCLLLDRST